MIKLSMWLPRAVLATPLESPAFAAWLYTFGYLVGDGAAADVYWFSRHWDATDERGVLHDQG